MADKDDAKTSAEMMYKRGIIRNALQAARAKLFGYVVSSDGRHEGVSRDLQKETVDHFSRAAVREAEYLIMERAKNIDESPPNDS